MELRKACYAVGCLSGAASIGAMYMMVNKADVCKKTTEVALQCLADAYDAGGLGTVGNIFCALQQTYAISCGIRAFKLLVFAKTCGTVAIGALIAGCALPEAIGKINVLKNLFNY